MLDRVSIRTCVIGLVLAAGAASAAGPAERAAVIVNGTRTAMIVLDVKDVQNRAWKSELLKGNPLGVQKETLFRHNTGSCVFDLKAKFEDGHRIFRKGVNFCQSPRYVVTDF